MSEGPIPERRAFKSLFSAVTSLIVGGLVAGIGGFFLGQMIERAKSAHETDLRVTAAQRNVIWNTMNGNDDAVPPGPEKYLGTAIAFLVSPDNKPLELRADAFGALLMKGIAFMTPEEEEGIKRAIAEGTIKERLHAIQTLHAADRQASTLLQTILEDTERLKLVEAGKPVPLETIENAR